MSAPHENTTNAVSEDQGSIAWHDPNYPHTLNQFTILHYFELSPFFDRASNNAIARRQGHDPAIPGALEFVARQGGVEYVLERAQIPHLFVLRKQIRKGIDASAPGALSIVAFYYVIDRVIYQAPTLHAVFSSRMQKCIWSLHQGLAKLQDDLDPLRAHLKEYKRIAEIEKKQQLELVEASMVSMKQSQKHASNGTFKDGAINEVEHSKEGKGLAKAQKQVALLPMAKKVSASDANQWRRTDNIIMSVLSRYQLPELPASYYKPCAFPSDPGSAAANEQQATAMADDQSHAPATGTMQEEEPDEQPKAKRVRI